MSEQETGPVGQEVAEQDESVEEQQALAPEQSDELERYKHKVAEAEKHRKEALKRLKDLEDKQRQAEEDQMKQKEQFKELYEKTEAEKRELAEQFEAHKQAIQAKELEGKSYKVASELTRDTARAELLAEKVAAFAKHTDDGLVYEIGGVEVDAAHLKKHLSEKYPFLVDGTGSVGGGAAGTQRPSGVSDVNQAAQDARKKGDLAGYLAAQLKH